MDTDEAMDDADAHIYTTTIIMHGEREAKTEDDDHISLIGGTPASSLAEVINRELSEALGTRRPLSPKLDSPNGRLWSAHICMGTCICIL
jgi:hypothetical protein